MTAAVRDLIGGDRLDHTAVHVRSISSKTVHDLLDRSRTADGWTYRTCCGTEFGNVVRPAVLTTFPANCESCEIATTGALR